MAIPVNPLEISGLVALAGTNTPSYNLPNPNQPLFDAARTNAMLRGQLQDTALRGQNQLDVTSLLGRNQLADIAAQGQNELANTKLQGQNVLDTLKQRNLFEAGQNDLNRQVDLQKLAELSSFHGGELGIQQQEAALKGQEIANTGAYQQGMLANEQQKLAQEKLVDQLKIGLKMKQQDLNMRGALSGSFLAGISQIDPKDPQYAQKVMSMRDQTVQLGLSKGILTKDEAQQLAQINDPNQLVQAARGDVFMTSMISQGKSNPGIMNTLGMGSPGTTLTVGPDGQITYSSIPEKGALEKTQEHLQAQQGLQQNLNNMIGVVRQNPEMFTYMGNKLAELHDTVERSPEFVQKAYDTLTQQFPNLDKNKAQQLAIAADSYDTFAKDFQANYAKQLSPVLLRNPTFASTITPNRKEVGYDTAVTKLYTWQHMLNEKAQLDGQYLKNGIVTDQKAYNAGLDRIAKDGQNTYNMFGKTYVDKTGKKVDFMYAVKNNPDLSPQDIISGLGLQEQK